MSEQMAKSAVPMRKMRLRPKRSPMHAADEDQRGQEEGVAFDHPLRLGRGGAEVALQHRQRHVDRRAVDEDHAGGQNGCHQHGAAGRRQGLRRLASAPCWR